MTYAEYKPVRDFIHDKSLRLITHEKKEFAKAGFPIQNYSYIDIKGNYYYIAKTNVFKSVIDEVLVKVAQMFPENFGTGSAKDVIEALYKIDPAYLSFDDFVEFLKSEQFCYVVERTSQGLTDKILRIDLFRHLKNNDEKNFDFVGGLFHSLKHFSYKGYPLSTGKDIHDLPYVEHLIISISRAFFSDQLKHKKDSNWTSFIDINEIYNLRVEFYYEKKSDVYFINTAFKEKKLP